MAELKDVNVYLAERALGEAELPFLSKAPDRSKLLIFQPTGNIVPSPDGLFVENKDLLVDQMQQFLRLAAASNVDFATCPEYSCPWDALISSVRENVFPRIGSLWSICCEGITTEQLELRCGELTYRNCTVILPDFVVGSGRFYNILCHLFHAKDEHGNYRRIALLQAKTTPMGGVDYERDSLLLGKHIFRFGRSNENRLVCLICSDVLGIEFRNEVVPQLQSNTLVVHLQLNRDSAAPGFRDYRDRCCYASPRTTEILCLNWAAGTRLKQNQGYMPWVEEPKTIYYRPLDGVDGTDADIISNHKKGCFLTYWSELKSAAFVFHPLAQVFLVTASKPLMEGAPTTTKRTAPKVEERFEWAGTEWVAATTNANDSFDQYLLANPQAAAHLAPYSNRYVDLERLMEFGAGYVLDEGSFEWRDLPSFRLAQDDTSSRLRLCWSNKGVGAGHRSECQRRFKSLVAIVDNPAMLPVRLAAFRGVGAKLTYEATPRFRKFRNLVHDNVRGTIVFLGADPGLDVLNEVKKRLEARLFDYDQDVQIISVLYFDPTGKVVDHMDSLPPAINDDPASDPSDISVV